MRLRVPTQPAAHNRCREPRTAMTCQPIIQRRYALFLREHDDCRGHHDMQPYMQWIDKEGAAFRRALGIHRFAPLPQDEFDAWLENRSRRVVECRWCCGDGHWHGVGCTACSGSGFVPDECNPVQWYCRPNACITDDEWASRQLSRSMRVDFDQTFDETDLPLFAQGGAS